MKKLTALLFVLLGVLLLAACGEAPHTHAPTSTVRENEVAATCTTEGSYDEVVKCAECGEELSRTAKTVEKTAHTPVIDPAVPATETATGLTEGSHCEDCKVVLVAQRVVPMLSHGITLASKQLTLSNTSLNGRVSADTEIFSFTQDITVTGNAAWVVSTDALGMQLVASKTVPLSAGDNRYYIHVTYPDSTVLTYTVDIYRNALYTVSFDLGNGETVPAQTVEEGSLATAPAAPSRAGYTFAGWDYDFTKAPTQSLTVKATWTAHTDTRYTVEYYLENLTKDGYDKVDTVTLTGTTDTVASAEQREYEHFLLDLDKSNVTGSITGDGSQVLKVYYGRMTYCIYEDRDWVYDPDMKSYPYGTEVTATAVPDLGYTFLGWYKEEELISTEPVLSVVIDGTIYAHYDVAEDMRPFEFTSTETTCVITEVKDKSVTTIQIPDYVTGIAPDAFRNCGALTYTEYGNAKYLGNETNPYMVLVTTKYDSIDNRIESCMVHERTRMIAPEAFFGCMSLESIHFAENSQLTSIGQGAFSDCTSLLNITLPKSVVSVGSRAFAACWSLESITLSESLTSIGDGMFYECGELKSITIPRGVTSIGEEAFQYCSKLESVTFENPNGWAAYNTPLSPSALSDLETAATYLKDTYCYYTWTRE